MIERKNKERYVELPHQMADGFYRLFFPHRKEKPNLANVRVEKVSALARFSSYRTLEYALN